MRYILMILTVVAVLAPSFAHAHGGGCRKASLPQCCHMETRTGIVHCH